MRNYWRGTRVSQTFECPLELRPMFISVRFGCVCSMSAEDENDIRGCLGISRNVSFVYMFDF